ncbi:NAD(P)-binding protein [Parathielavia appendiculata]|uniref:NAD(P)-binding protein n=1 Tax=Parathielavia appendiculata TaxID=2587402 RepID=A0AAN6TT53_9PEZI|nr:NAD(P)-binding protein [Parathielavia appendiculata]
MAQRFPSVALIGATGNVGALILKALQEAQPAFNSITLLTRSAKSAATLAQGPNIQIKEVDYSSRQSLVAALTRVDAVVSAIGTKFVDDQKTIIDAAVEAGVKFFIPSEFGLANTHPLLRRDFSIFDDKNRIQAHLESYLQQGKIDYALTFVGLWLDWGIQGFILDVNNKKVGLWDGGERPISMTTMASIGKAVLGILEGKVAAGKREVRVKDINLSQKRLYELAAEVVGKDGWEVKTVDTARAKTVASEKLSQGTATLDNIYAFVYRASTAEEYGQPWKPDEDDSERLGLVTWTEDDVKNLIRNVVAGKQ